MEHSIGLVIVKFTWGSGKEDFPTVMESIWEKINMKEAF